MLALFAIPSVPFVAALGCALKYMILASLGVGSYDLRFSWHIPDRYVISPTNGKSPTKNCPMANPRLMANPWMMANPRRSHNFQIRTKYYQTLTNILNYILKHTRRRISSWLLLPKAPAFSSPCFSWLQEATSSRSWHTLLSKPDLSSRLQWISIAMAPLIQQVQHTGELDMSASFVSTWQASEGVI